MLSEATVPVVWYSVRLSPPVVNVVGGAVGATADGAAGSEILVLAVPTAADAKKPTAANTADRNFISNVWERLLLCFVVSCRDGHEAAVRVGYVPPGAQRILVVGVERERVVTVPENREAGSGSARGRLPLSKDLASCVAGAHPSPLTPQEQERRHSFSKHQPP